MAEKEKEYKWKFGIRENSMTTDVTTDYVATVDMNKSLTIEDIAKRIVKKRTEYRPDTIANIVNMFEEEARYAIGEGNNVVMNNVRFQIGISGVFDSNGTIDPEKNKPIVSAIPTDTLNTELDLVELEYNKQVLDQGGARINEVKDLDTGTTDGTCGRDHTIHVSGNKVKSVNKDGTGIGKVALVNVNGIEEIIPHLIYNFPGYFTFRCPADLAEGEYELLVETYYASGGTQLLKNPHVLTYSVTLV